MTARRRRTISIALGCLILGAIVNVAVAWAIAIWVEYPPRAVLEELHYVDAPDMDRHIVLVARGFGAELLFGKYDGVFYKEGWSSPELKTVAPRNDWIKWSSIRSRTLDDYKNADRFGPHIVGEEACGWPLFSFYWQHQMLQDSHGHWNFGGIEGGINLGGNTQRVPFAIDEAWQDAFDAGHVSLRPSYGVFTPEDVLPYLPIWLGLVLNTAFYATALWLLFVFPFTLRGWNRIRRGLCPACKYPIGTSELCTECGKPVTPSRV